MAARREVAARLAPRPALLPREGDAAPSEKRTYCIDYTIIYYMILYDILYIVSHNITIV